MLDGSCRARSWPATRCRRAGGEAAEAVYDPTGRRDPFGLRAVNQTNLLGEARTPLQRYDLGQLRRRR